MGFPSPHNPQQSLDLERGWLWDTPFFQQLKSAVFPLCRALPQTSSPPIITSPGITRWSSPAFPPINLAGRGIHRIGCDPSVLRQVRFNEIPGNGSVYAVVEHGGAIPNRTTGPAE
jgi:hypothetical protein